MHFYKYHGLGNDYIVIDPIECPVPMNENNIRLICDRNYGIGSDGILCGPEKIDDLYAVRIFNPDGSEAEKSGNGIRIFAQYLIDKQYVTNDCFSISTKGGKVNIQVLDREQNLMKVDMGHVTFNSSRIPVASNERDVISENLLIDDTTYQITCLSIGNPHCVIPVSSVSKQLALKLGPIIENHDLFPNRINMQLLEVIDRNTIKIEIWERGAGYTLASGSSSCAAASAAHKLGLVDNTVTVIMPGGTLYIEIEHDMVRMTGKVASIAQGNFTSRFLEQLVV